MAGALRTFEEAGLVREFGRTTGRRGPSASLYQRVSDAVLVLGVDIGARYVRSVLADLDGATVEELTLRLARPHADEVVAAVGELRAWIGDAAGRTELAVVGTPGVVDPASGRIGAAPNIEAWEGVLAERVLARALGLPVRIENDVNLAALGEQAHGGGRGAENFAYLTVGSGLGAGIVLNRRLHRGARGAAGEVGFLPVGDDPFAATRRTEKGAMERQLSSAGLVAAAERLAGTTATALSRRSRSTSCSTRPATAIRSAAPSWPRRRARSRCASPASAPSWTSTSSCSAAASATTTTCCSPTSAPRRPSCCRCRRASSARRWAPGR